jgi:class 3 adenylate cyclase
MTDPVYRTILLFDIEQFGSRDDVEQAFLRRLLYEVVDATLFAAGIDGSARLRADRGDSVMELIDVPASVPALVKTLLTETPALLHSKNRLIASSAQMRLRVALSSGYVAVDELDGWVGSDLNHAVRLLDSDPLRDALKARDDHSVLCVSDGVYQGVVRHGPLGVRPDDFHRITVETKEGPTVAWLHGEPGVSQNMAAEPASVPDPPAPSPTATHVHGDLYGQTGGTLHGGQRFDFTRRERD